MKSEARSTKGSSAGDIEQVRRFYNKAAPAYDGWMRVFDRLLLGGGRKRLCSRAAGPTLELAIGTGLNLAFYPRDVRLAGVDLTPGMLAEARRRAETLGLDVRLLLADAQKLPVPDNSFDTVVCTLSLCTIPDERRALAEAHRVLRPGGQLLLLEHVRSPVAAVRFVQRLLDPLARMAADHLLRDPLDHLESVGFGVEHCDRSKMGIVEEVVARKAR